MQLHVPTTTRHCADGTSTLSHAEALSNRVRSIAWQHMWTIFKSGPPLLDELCRSTMSKISFASQKVESVLLLSRSAIFREIIPGHLSCACKFQLLIYANRFLQSHPASRNIPSSQEFQIFQSATVARRGPVKASR